MEYETRKTGSVYQKGQQVGRYRIIGVLEQGKFTDTYLVELPQSAASMMEVFLPPLTNDLKTSFLMQTQELMKLEHPNIQRIRDAGVENHYPFLVTDYMSHTPLSDVFPQGNKQTFTKILPYLKQLASALQYTHDCGLFHGDVRPKNILLTREDNVLLRGFLIPAITQNREHLNFYKVEILQQSVAYNAPEQIQGKASAASDQYALAIVIYELLSGELPFTGSYFQVANYQVNTPCPPLRQKAPDILPAVDKTIMRALEKRPEQRFRSIKEFISELELAYTTPYRDNVAHRASPPVAPARPVHTPDPALVLPASYTQAVPPYNAPVSPQIPNPVSPPPVVAPQRLDARAYQPVPSPMPPPIVDSPLAPRHDGNTVTRRVFAVGLIGLGLAGGAGGWYILSQRLKQPPASPVPPPNDTQTHATPTVVNNKNALIFTGHLAAVNALTWSPDGKSIASASDDKFVQVFDATSGKRKFVYNGHTEEVATVAWSPNGKLLVSGGQDKTVQVWDATNGKKIFTYKGHTDRVNSVDWSSNNLSIASGSEDKTVQVWNATNGALSFNFLGHTGGVLCVGWQPGNSSVASGSWDGTLRDWAITQHGDHFNAGEQIFSYGGHGKNEVYGLSWSPDGNFIASAGADQVVQLSNGSDGTPRPQFFTGHQSKTHSNPVRTVSWSPDGNHIASGDTNGVVLVWNVAGRKTIFTYKGHKGAVNSIAWSPDGKKIASASADMTVQVWQPA